MKETLALGFWGLLGLVVAFGLLLGINYLPGIVIAIGVVILTVFLVSACGGRGSAKKNRDYHFRLDYEWTNPTTGKVEQDPSNNNRRALWIVGLGTVCGLVYALLCVCGYAGTPYLERGILEADNWVHEAMQDPNSGVGMRLNKALYNNPNPTYDDKVKSKADRRVTWEAIKLSKGERLTEEHIEAAEAKRKVITAEVAKEFPDRTFKPHARYPLGWRNAAWIFFLFGIPYGALAWREELWNLVVAGSKLWAARKKAKSGDTGGMMNMLGAAVVAEEGLNLLKKTAKKKG